LLGPQLDLDAPVLRAPLGVVVARDRMHLAEGDRREAVAVDSLLLEQPHDAPGARAGELPVAGIDLRQRAADRDVVGVAVGCELVLRLGELLRDARRHVAALLVEVRRARLEEDVLREVEADPVAQPLDLHLPRGDLVLELREEPVVGPLHLGELAPVLAELRREPLLIALEVRDLPAQRVALRGEPLVLPARDAGGQARRRGGGRGAGGGEPTRGPRGRDDAIPCLALTDHHHLHGTSCEGGSATAPGAGVSALTPWRERRAHAVARVACSRRSGRPTCRWSAVPTWRRVSKPSASK